MIKIPLSILFYHIFKVVPVSLYKIIKEKKSRIRTLWLQSKFRRCGKSVFLEELVNL